MVWLAKIIYYQQTGCGLEISTHLVFDSFFNWVVLICLLHGMYNWLTTMALCTTYEPSIL